MIPTKKCKLLIDYIYAKTSYSAYDKIAFLRTELYPYADETGRYNSSIAFIVLTKEFLLSILLTKGGRDTYIFFFSSRPDARTKNYKSGDLNWEKGHVCARAHMH